MFKLDLYRYIGYFFVVVLSVLNGYNIYVILIIYYYFMGLSVCLKVP